MRKLEIINEPSSFFKRMLNFRQRNKFCDVEVSFNGERILAHSIVLASSSEYFEIKLVDQQFPTVLTLQKVNSEAVKHLIEYCYTGKITINNGNAREILKAANMMFFTNITEGCCKILKEELNSDNCLELWSFAKTQNAPELQDHSFDYARENFKTIIQSADFTKLSFDDIIELIKSDLDVDSEMEVYAGVKKWIDADRQDRYDKLMPLLKYVKLPFLPQKVLFDATDSLCKVDSECLILFLQALQWQTKTKFPELNSFQTEPRKSFSTMLVLGGNTLDQAKTVEVFNQHQNTWTRLPDIQINRLDFGCVLLEDNLILIGGRAAVGLKTVNTVESYNLKSGAVLQLTPMAEARWVHATVKFKNCIYVMGGLRDGVYVKSVEKWNPTSNVWTNETTLASPRYGCKAAVFGDEIFLIGGFQNGVYHSDNDAFNPKTGKWRKCSPMSESRYAPAFATIGDYLYAIGGDKKSLVQLTSAERYDPVVDKWSNIQSIEIPRSWSAISNFNQNILLVGGHNDTSKYLSVVTLYDLSKNQWINMPPLNVPRSNFALLRIPRNLLKN